MRPLCALVAVLGLQACVAPCTGSCPPFDPAEALGVWEVVAVEAEDGPAPEQVLSRFGAVQLDDDGLRLVWTDDDGRAWDVAWPR